ncbi:hypothetical protein I6F14_36720, partial [Bradyrhizobium sp. IC3069]|nr:hypothetical protein [Bradyrhizobium sp. IC3069]
MLLPEEDEVAGQKLDAGEYAVVTIADDGPGIDPDIVDKVFDPFFTT